MNSRHNIIASTFACAMLLTAPSVTLAGGREGISAERLMAHTKYLASDELEGRAPGTRGEALTVRYLTEQLRDMGLDPGNPDGMWVQEVPLTGVTVTNNPELVIADVPGGGTLRFAYGTDFVAWSGRQRPTVELKDAEVLFVGYGIVAPEYDWDDFKDVDVSGKVVLMLVGDPPHPDPSLFAGPAMTYYGRWTYKYEVAAMKGAAAAVVIHTPEEAGYPWGVVQNSWTGEQLDVERAEGDAPICAVESWISSGTAEELFKAAGSTLADATREALSRQFRPRSLGLTASVRIDSDIRRLVSHNVVGLLPGMDPDARSEHVIYTAHWDHLGRGEPVDGDSIYNGALDNASGVAGVLEIARAFTAIRRDLHRSVLFMFTTAEEGGLLGAGYYVQHPLYPLDRAVAAINVDGLNVWGRTSDIVIIGYGYSDLDALVETEAAAQDRHVRPDASPEKGYYFRSDHFAFAQKGVPALYAESGVSFRGKPEGWGKEARNRYLLQRYHKPQDEVDPSWDTAGAVEDMELLYRVGRRIATTGVYPRWSKTSGFGFRNDGGNRPNR
jgi:Zn-dependent M28 family amino/carboxypeptidase